MWFEVFLDDECGDVFTCFARNTLEACMKALDRFPEVRQLWGTERYHTRAEALSKACHRRHVE